MNEKCYFCKLQIVERMRLRLCIKSNDVWQMRLIRNYMNYIIKNRRYNGLFSNELMSSFIEQFQREIEHQKQRQDILVLLQQFASSKDFRAMIQNLCRIDVMTLMTIIIFYNLEPQPTQIMSKSMNLIGFLRKSREKNLDPSTAHFLMNIFRSTKLSCKT